jgi:nicotinate-nucleotide--dimethylbenzimidazole phosphoribosyltransferase
LAALAEVGGLEHAALAGFVLGAAAARVPVLLDGAIAGSAALVAAALCPTAIEYTLAGHTSVEPGHAIALESLGLRPLLGLDLRLGEGTGALLALPLVASAARALRDVATFYAAGVTEK